MDFPVDQIIPQLSQRLGNGPAALLVAEPGAGKTTRVPLKLLDAPWLKGQKIVMLEPRRLAARNAAHRMAETLGEEVGGTVGYTVRLERRVSAQTRIEVVTEGILTRRLQHDPELSGTGLVIFDEFHERSLDADFGLALTLDIQRGLARRPQDPRHVGDARCRARRRASGRCPGHRCAGPRLPGGDAPPRQGAAPDHLGRCRPRRPPRAG